MDQTLPPLRPRSQSQPSIYISPPRSSTTFTSHRMDEMSMVEASAYLHSISGELASAQQLGVPLHSRSLSSSSAESTGMPKKTPNAFLLYRRDRRSQFKAQQPEMTVQAISRELGKCWKEETAEVRCFYQDMADRLKLDVQEKFPGIPYRVRKERRRHRGSVDEQPSTPPCQLQQLQPQQLAGLQSASRLRHYGSLDAALCSNGAAWDWSVPVHSLQVLGIGAAPRHLDR